MAKNTDNKQRTFTAHDYFAYSSSAFASVSSTSTDVPVMHVFKFKNILKYAIPNELKVFQCPKQNIPFFMATIGKWAYINYFIGHAHFPACCACACFLIFKGSASYENRCSVPR